MIQPQKDEPTMPQRVARTLRYLAKFINQETARTNAAEGSAAFRKRRQDVGEYLQGRDRDLSDK